MRAYIALFKLKFITNLQYRAAALAGLSTQFFFGIMFIMVYFAFYESNSNSAPMELHQLVSYLWLNQAFFALIYLWHKDQELLSMIRTGDIAYELCRPQGLYFKWYFKILATKLSSVTLRCLPVIIIALILPAPYNLGIPNSILAFIAFLISLIIAAFLVTSIITLFHILTFFTVESSGILNMVIVIAEVFAGVIVPVPFLPDFLKTIANILPFRYISDLPFRLYSGDIPIDNAFPDISIQLIWIFITISIGYFLTKYALKRVTVQGG